MKQLRLSLKVTVCKSRVQARGSQEAMSAEQESHRPGTKLPKAFLRVSDNRRDARSSTTFWGIRVAAKPNMKVWSNVTPNTITTNLF